MTISIATVRAVQHLKILRYSYQKTQSLCSSGAIRKFHKRFEADSTKITIDGIEKNLKTPKDPLYVPYKFSK